MGDDYFSGQDAARSGGEIPRGGTDANLGYWHEVNRQRQEREAREREAAEREQERQQRANDELWARVGDRGPERRDSTPLHSAGTPGTGRTDPHAIVLVLGVLSLTCVGPLAGVPAIIVAIRNRPLQPLSKVGLWLAVISTALVTAMVLVLVGMAIVNWLTRGPH